MFMRHGRKKVPRRFWGRGGGWAILRRFGGKGGKDGGVVWATKGWIGALKGGVPAFPVGTVFGKRKDKTHEKGNLTGLSQFKTKREKPPRKGAPPREAFT